MIHFPEPEFDLVAQIQAMFVGAKKCVFISNTNVIPKSVELLLKECFVCRRSEGTLLTQDEGAAILFNGAPFLTESLMALLLEYPQSKDELKNPTVVQIRNEDGAVLYECATDDPATVRARATNLCGTVVELSIYEALLRRMRLINGPV